MPTADSRLAPGRALLHPAWWAALLVLALNDHTLKAAGVLPGWVTGKLSDFAGLLIAPALMATLVRARSERAVVACHGIVGAAFALLELSPGAARLHGALLGALGVPHQTWADPTDLLALPMLWVSMRVLLPWMRRETVALKRVWSVALRGSALVLGTASVLATSAHRPATNPAPGKPGHVLADVFLHVPADTGSIVVALRSLTPAASFDCQRALRQPGAALTPELFGAATTWVQFPGENIPLRPSGAQGDTDGCHAVMLQLEESNFFFEISSDEMQWAYVVWSARSLPVRAIPDRSEDAIPEGALVVREAAGGGLTIEKKGNIAIGPAPQPKE